MKKNKKDPTYNQHLDQMVAKKEQLPFHKMDDISRRRFIHSIGYFLGALSVPSIIRLETMSKISKKLLGNSLAFAADIAADPIKIGFYFRAGYGFVPWLVGCASDNQVNIGVDQAADRNIAWGPDTTTSVATNTSPVILPPHSAGLTAYANGIQAIQCFQSMGGHSDTFNGTWVSGSCELLAARAKTEIDAGAQTLLTQPFGYYSSNDFGIQSVPAMLASYVPASYSSAATVSNLFTPPTLTTSQGNALSSTLQKSLFGVMQSSFSKDVENALYETNKEVIDSSNKQAYKILSTNYQALLDPTQNTATMNLLTAGLPAQTRMSTNVAPAQALYQIVTAANKGITPRCGVIGFTTGDWHNDNANFALGNANAGSTRAASAAFLATLIKNLFDAVNAGTWVNEITGQNEKIEIICASEFTRTNDTNGATDDGDGSNNAILILSSDVNQTRFKAGSFGKVSATGQTMGLNTTNLTHAANISAFTTMQAFHHNAALFGVKPSDFNVSGSGIGGNMVS